MGLGAASTAAQYFVTHSQPSHNPVNLDFLLDPLSKSEFLSFSYPFAQLRAGNLRSTLGKNGVALPYQGGFGHFGDRGQGTDPQAAVGRRRDPLQLLNIGGHPLKGLSREKTPP